jgi:ubiquinone biosynthesis protein
VVNDYETTITDELDLLREAANTSQLRRNFEGSEQIYFPQVYWDLCRENVMVAERVYGIPINQIDELKSKNTDYCNIGYYCV